MRRPVTPSIRIDLAKVERNARAVVGLCGEHGISVVGVTKGVCGHPGIAGAMLRGGVISIADSRLQNLRRLREAGIEQCMLLRMPALSAVEDIVALAGSSLNSEVVVLAALAQAARKIGKVHDVMLMVDLGDLREGIWPADLDPFLREVVSLRGIRIRGLGTNLSCFGAVVPSETNMQRLVELAEQVESTLGERLDWISGANSSALELIGSGRMPKRVNHARMGEAILLGRETIHRRPWPGTVQDAFVLYTEVLEKKRKPSVPIGERGEDAFGAMPEYEDRGERVRALVNIGREDTMAEGLTPLLEGVRIVGATSGYLIADVTEACESIEVGTLLAFRPSYGALLATMTSGYVKKAY